jgi:isoleucyl-tRNA synthetase
MLPFLTESIYQNLVMRDGIAAPDSVHLTRWPSAELAALRDTGLEGAMATVQRAVELARTLRAQAGIRTRQPLARLWIALPGDAHVELDALLGLVAEEVNVREVVLIGDESALVERRVKPLLPKIGKKLGPAVPAVMAAAREGRFEVRPDGSVALGGVVLAPDEVEILAAPRPGTAVAHDDGLVVVIDTELTDELRAEGDARELQRAIQDLRRDVGLKLDDRIDVVVALPDAVAGVRPHLAAVAAETLAHALVEGPLPDGWPRATVVLGGTVVAIAIQRRGGGAS